LCFNQVLSQSRDSLKFDRFGGVIAPHLTDLPLQKAVWGLYFMP
jgi:hypothetical protein